MEAAMMNQRVVVAEELQVCKSQLFLIYRHRKLNLLLILDPQLILELCDARYKLFMTQITVIHSAN